MTIATDADFKDILIDLMENHRVTMHVEFLTNIDLSIPGATGHQSGFFWVMKDAADSIMRIQRITMHSVNFREGPSDVAVTELADLNDDVLRTSMTAMLRLAIRAREEEVQKARLGNYEYSKVMALLDMN